MTATARCLAELVSDSPTEVIDRGRRCKTIVATLMRQQVNLWPVMEDKEKWVRFTACAAAPFQIFVVSGCNNWTDLFSCLVTDWAVP